MHERFAAHELLELHELLTGEVLSAQKSQIIGISVTDTDVWNFIQKCNSLKQRRIQECQALIGHGYAGTTGITGGTTDYQSTYGAGSYGANYGTGSYGATSYGTQSAYNQGAYGQGSYGQGSSSQGSYGQGSYEQRSYEQNTGKFGKESSGYGSYGRGVSGGVSGAYQNKGSQANQGYNFGAYGGYSSETDKKH